MFLICGMTSWILVEYCKGYTVVRSCGTLRSVNDLQALLYKTYSYVLEHIHELTQKPELVQEIIEDNISIYKINIPTLHINPARCESIEEKRYEYICSKLKLFGYMFVDPAEVVEC